jgi:hypothetical protein
VSQSGQRSFDDTLKSQCRELYHLDELSGAYLDLIQRDITPHQDYNIAAMQIDWAQFVPFIGYNIDLTAFLAGPKYVAIGKSLAIHQEPYTTTMRNW